MFLGDQTLRPSNRITPKLQCRNLQTDAPVIFRRNGGRPAFPSFGKNNCFAIGTSQLAKMQGKCLIEPSSSATIVGGGIVASNLPGRYAEDARTPRCSNHNACMYLTRNDLVWNRRRKLLTSLGTPAGIVARSCLGNRGLVCPFPAERLNFNEMARAPALVHGDCRRFCSGAGRLAVAVDNLCWSTVSGHFTPSFATRRLKTAIHASCSSLRLSTTASTSSSVMALASSKSMTTLGLGGVAFALFAGALDFFFITINVPTRGVVVIKGCLTFTHTSAHARQRYLRKTKCSCRCWVPKRVLNCHSLSNKSVFRSLSFTSRTRKGR